MIEFKGLNLYAIAQPQFVLYVGNENFTTVVMMEFFIFPNSCSISLDANSVHFHCKANSF